MQTSGACSTAHRPSFLSHCSGVVSCWTLTKVLSFFDGSNFNADPNELQVT